jgi:hypothetical protein
MWQVYSPVMLSPAQSEKNSGWNIEYIQVWIWAQEVPAGESGLLI